MLSSPQPAPSLIVFARYPRFGRVKTRLASSLGDAWTLHVYRAMLLDALDRFGRVPACRRRLFLSECSREEGEALAAESQSADGFEISLQIGPALGERLSNAVASCSRSPDGFVIVGVDSPTLPLDYLRSAGRLLKKTPVVIGPSVDGGYYLLGLREPRTDLFEGIDWGSNRVLDQTAARLRDADYALLPCWYDVDTASDLDRLRAEVIDSPEWRHSRLRAVLRRLDEERSDSASAARGKPAGSTGPDD